MSKNSIGTDVDAEHDPFGGPALECVVPTTDPQREVWTADRMDEESSLAFNQIVAIRMHGPLDPGALEAALAETVSRHQSLRATFTDDGMQMLVAASGSISLERVDLAGRGGKDAEACLDEALRREAEEPFDLSVGPLIRTRLFRLAPAHHVLVIAAHHIVCDGWSFGVVVDEVSTLYSRAVDAAVPGPPRAERFADLAISEAAWRGDTRRSTVDAYWKGVLSGPAPVLELPADTPRPTLPMHASRRADRSLPADLARRLEGFAASSGTSLFQVLAGAFALLLARMSGQKDVVLGIPVAGQPLHGMPRLVGHCVHFLPLRLRIEPEAGRNRLCAEVAERSLGMLDHARTTLATLLETVSRSRDHRERPLIDVMFNLNARDALGEPRFEGIDARLDTVPRRYERYDLFLNIVEREDGLALECQYAERRFEHATVAAWLESYESLLNAWVDPAYAGAPVSALPLITPVRLRERVAVEGRQIAAGDPSGTSRPSTWLRDAAERVALREAGGTEVTYGEMECWSNRIARVLRARGIGRGARVGLCVERGAAMVAGLLGVLKSGAAYVPLDPGFPEERLRYMAEDARLAGLVTQASLAGRFEVGREATLLLDGDAGLIEAQPGEALAGDGERDAGPEDAAYVIYTSGSTGKPKGVVVPHGAVTNFLASMAREPGLRAGDVLVAVTTLSFDIAVLELLGPLTVGATVVLAGREQALDGQALGRLLEESGATLMQATPSTWQMLLEAGWRAPAGFRGLIGGEALPGPLAGRLLEAGVELWNMYGPTETTVWSTCWKVERPEEGIRIGRPIANTQVWVVDGHGQLCPIGVPGEIWIGGAGVASGYWERAELTAERFVADRFGGTGGRLYRTGDRGRWRADGQLEHLGRLDFQVKVRGYRIEPGEIEAVLGQHAQVAQAVVVAREDRPGDVRLVAYVVARGEMAAAGELRQHLRAQLPEYIVPQHYVGLQALPLTPNGKIDRKALPAPEAVAHAAAEAVHEAARPLTEAERLIAQVWGELLGVSDIRAEDNFFDLGGHSLLAMQAIARLHKRTGVRLRPQQFTFETLAQIAASLEGPAAEARQTASRPAGLIGRLFGRRTG
jgi:amino acid adenylation domain-containing protein